MSDARKTRAELLAEVRELRARLAESRVVPADAGGAASDSQEHFRAVADYTYDLESWVGPDGRLLWVNPAVERLTGYSVAECLAMHDYPLPLVHPADQVEIVRVWEGALAGSSGNDVPFRLRCKDGRLRWVAVSWQPIHSSSGACLGHRSSIRDISDRKQVEDALRAQRALLDKIITHIPCGVYWKDRELRYRGCNAEFARAAGVPQPADIVGRTDFELAWERAQAEWFRSCDERVLTSGEALLNIEEAERQADGRVALLLTSKVPLRDAEGQVCGVLGIDTDISELKAAEAELRRARDELELRVQERTAELALANERLHEEIAERVQAEDEARQHHAALMHMARLSTVGELTAQLAHELNQPLCTIVGNAQTAQRLLAQQPPDLVELRAALADIAADGNRAAEIIHRLRDFLRLQQPEPVVLNVERMIADIAALVEADARRHDARVDFEISARLPAVRGDPIQFQQVILNLARNGLEAMLGLPAGARVLTLRACPDDSGGVVISVSDCGSGLADAVAARIFEPFFTTKPSGLGMGLVISRSIAEAYGGRLWLSHNTGSGATFCLGLPGATREDTA